MSRDPLDIPDAELAVLTALWDTGPATIRQLVDRLYPQGTDAHYATVQKLLERLEDRGFVRHVRREGVLVYRATVGRDELISRIRFEPSAPSASESPCR